MKRGSISYNKEWNNIPKKERETIVKSLPGGNILIFSLLFLSIAYGIPLLFKYLFHKTISDWFIFLALAILILGSYYWITYNSKKENGKDIFKKIIKNK